MNPAWLLLIFVLSSFHLSNSIAQQPTSGLHRDAKAVALVQQTLAVMGSARGVSFTDSLATGQAQISSQDGTTTSFPIKKKTKGTKMVRTELQRPEGTNVRILNNGAAVVVLPNGSVRPLTSNNTMAERVDHIPALSLLAEFQEPRVEVRYIGTDSINAQPADIVALSYIATSDPGAADAWRSMTQTLFYVDQNSKLISKIQYQNVAENNTNLSDKIDVFFSDYRDVSGVLVPFRQSSYSNGELSSTITFTSVAFNTGLSDSEFALPVGN